MSTTLTRNENLEVIKNYLKNGGQCIGYQTLAVTNAAVVQLTVPEGAQSAEVTLESAGSTVTAMAARYTLDGTTPVTGGPSVDGVPIGDFDTIEILGNSNITAFKVIAADAANTKYLKIHYFR